jgi:DNA mismatch endonuclease (patch repair protein)
MTDIVSPEKRSRMMAGIRGKNTKPELLIRSGLHKAGFRFRIHGNILPGKPDIVLPKFKAVIFVHGCFWHGHVCHLFKWPSSRKEFWKQKITGNQLVDARNFERLRKEGWRVGVIWECALKGKKKLDLTYVVDVCKKWLLSNQQTVQIQA